MSVPCLGQQAVEVVCLHGEAGGAAIVFAMHERTLYWVTWAAVWTVQDCTPKKQKMAVLSLWSRKDNMHKLIYTYIHTLHTYIHTYNRHSDRTRQLTWVIFKKPALFCLRFQFASTRRWAPRYQDPEAESTIPLTLVTWPTLVTWLWAVQHGRASSPGDWHMGHQLLDSARRG